MISAILNRLESDNELKSLLGAGINKDGEYDSKIYPLFTISDDTSLVYTDSIVSGGDIRENRLEFRIITKDYEVMTQIEKRLCKLLDIKEYEQTFRYENISILKSSLVGGGTLEHDATHKIERILLFQIKWKERLI